MKATDEEISKLILSYAGSLRPWLSYEDFLKIVLPADSSLREIITQRPNYRVEMPGKLSPKVEALLTELLKEEILKNYQSELKRYSLKQRCYFTLLGAFRTIAKPKSKAISVEDVELFLSTNGAKESLELANLLVRRMDRDCDGELSFREFSNGLMPNLTVPASTSIKPKPLNSEKKNFPPRFSITSPDRTAAKSESRSIIHKALRGF